MKLNPISIESFLSSLGISGKPQRGIGESPAFISTLPSESSRVTLDKTVNYLLKELTAAVKTRQIQLNSLPPTIKEAVIELLSKSMSSTTLIQQGLPALNYATKEAAEKIMTFAGGLRDALFVKGLVSNQKLEVLSEALNTLIMPFWERDQISSPKTSNVFSDISESEYISKIPAKQSGFKESTGTKTVAGSPQSQLVDTNTESSIAQTRMSELMRLLIADGFASVEKLLISQPELQQIIKFALTQDNIEEQPPILKTLLNEVSENAPENLRNIASKHDLPQLITLWAGLKSQEACRWVNIDARQLHKAQDVLIKLAESIQSPPASLEEAPLSMNTGKTFSLALPLYFENSTGPYPAYIHIYQDEHDKDAGNGGAKPETWVRICLVTENIGLVDALFHLHHDNLLNVRVAFACLEARAVFSEYVSEMELGLSKSTIKLTDFIVK